ncbi:Putative uncharacterized membrane protein [Latilactobacillus curvatus]|uniref:hypothetical protein n=1 Tax=Latilactobacillus curvatus TaxID=28038 RepID=UPI000975D408|nr:hypothetical protein [Latilactobacillus curvatus]SMH68295.1 Putative uncharacterized membrane protein [Latilactobacillus curvatus]
MFILYLWALLSLVPLLLNAIPVRAITKRYQKQTGISPVDLKKQTYLTYSFVYEQNPLIDKATQWYIKALFLYLAFVAGGLAAASVLVSMDNITTQLFILVAFAFVVNACYKFNQIQRLSSVVWHSPEGRQYLADHPAIP